MNLDDLNRIFPDEYFQRDTIIKYLVSWIQSDTKRLPDNNAPEIRNSIISFNRGWLLKSTGTPSILRTLCEEKNLHYEEVVEILLRNVFSDPNDIEWWNKKLGFKRTNRRDTEV